MKAQRELRPPECEEQLLGIIKQVLENLWSFYVAKASLPAPPNPKEHF
jgi:hypothetical protein